MKFAINIARRYLFGKKSTNAINILTWTAISGIAIGTAALLLILSVFNGLEELIQSLYSSFQPAVMISSDRGKVFEPDSLTYTRLLELNGVDKVAQSLEETAFFEYKGSQTFGILKGVDEAWVGITHLDSVIYEGEYKLKDNKINYAVIGYGLRNNLSINVQDYLSGLTVYMLKNKNVGHFEKPFRQKSLQPAGIFGFQQQFDGKYIISDLAFAQKLRGYKHGEISQIEVGLEAGADEGETIAAIKKLMGPGFKVQSQYEQNAAFFRLMNIERWIGFAITSLTMMLIAINMIGCVLMIVNDKKKDISILKSMGASNRLIGNIFLNIGVLMTLLGMGVGFVLGVGFYAAHKAFNLVPMEGFIVEAYPASMRGIDFFIIMFFVLSFGILASIYPALFASRISSVQKR